MAAGTARPHKKGKKSNFFIDNLRWYTIYYILARLASKGGTLKNVQNISAQKAAEKKRARFPQKNVDQKRA